MMKKLLTTFLLLMMMSNLSAQNTLPTAAQCVSDDGQRKLYLNLERKATEDDPANVVSVWLTENGRTTKLLTTNPLAEGAWSRMTGGNAASVDVRQIATADKAIFIPYDQNLIYLEGCPDARNVYSYILNISTNTAIQLPSNAGVAGLVGEDETYIVMQSYRYDYENGGRYPVLQVYDLNGQFFKELSLQK